ncbi:MAG: N-6 DNA methylase [Chloroflexi bacterium]|nr:N-6 DNA methylase [Chloroflexota bacterium]
MHELTFVDHVTNWINAILARRLDLPFREATIEESGKGSRKRRDLTLYGKDGKLALTGEIKLPDKPDGLTPYNEMVVMDAHQKANDEGVKHFFTWNVNRLVLWQTFEPGVPLIQRDQLKFDVIQVHDSKLLTLGVNQAKIQTFLETFLTTFADIYRGLRVLPVKPLDERFIDMLDTALDSIAFHTLDALTKRYGDDTAFRGEMTAWMVNKMGWTLAEDTLFADLERAAKTSCYRLVNKLMFYSALRRRYSDKLPAIAFGPLEDTGEKMSQALNRFFERAMLASGDYETVYLHDFADTLPFMAPVALEGWRILIEHIDAYDFTRLNYDIVGRVFERLISPSERHRYGQHYTMPDLVDLINGFCIRQADETVADPACGGGTFLVRAYIRKRQLSTGKLSHAQLLQQIFGVDISPFAAHLALINLAARNLDSEPNYPQVAVEDFFNVRRGRPVFQVPTQGALKVGGLGNGQPVQVAIEQVDAMVGNPPYIRQELIDRVLRVKNGPAESSYKAFLGKLFEEEWGGAAPKPSARSDIYVHFWPHAAHFLKEGGHIGFLTGSGWLENEYGFKLQEFMLERFRVIAVLESEVEPWFTEARVNTAATILQRTDDPQARAGNAVKFILLHRKLSDLLPQIEDEAARLAAVDALVAEIEGLTESTKDERWRVRVVNQGELTLAGWQFEDEEAEPPTAWNGDWSVLRQQKGEYVGSKWSVHLRAPDLFFELMDAFRDRLVPLRSVAKVSYGVKSGADEFFYVQDITDAVDDVTLAGVYGVNPDQKASLRVVRAGDGSAHVLEARYLRPLVFNVMEVDGAVVDPKGLKKQVLLVSESQEELTDTHVLRYIRYGEQQGYHERPTCAARVSDDPDHPRQWYDLRPPEPGAVFWPQAHQYRHIVPLNRGGNICNKRFFNVYPKHDGSPKVLAALLNSTLTWFFKDFYARNVGREGYLDTDVFATKLIPIMRMTDLSSAVAERLSAAFDALSLRPLQPIYPMGDELEQTDRVELDNAVFEALGVADPTERQQWREQVYTEMRRMYKRKRELEEIAMENRNKAARTKHTANARTVVKDIWREIDKTVFRRFPEDFVLPGTSTKQLHVPEGEVKVGRELFTGFGALGVGYIQVGDELKFVESLAKADFVQAWREAGNTGTAFVPHDDDVCAEVCDAYRQYRSEIELTLYEWAASRTADEGLQTQVVTLLWKHIGEHVRALSR